MRWAVVRGVISGFGEGDGEWGLEWSRACGEGERGGEKKREVLERREESVDDDVGGVLDGCRGREGANCTGVLKAHHISSLRQTISSPRTSMPIQSPMCAILTTGTGDVGDSSFTSGSSFDSSGGE